MVCVVYLSTECVEVVCGYITTTTTIITIIFPSSTSVVRHLTHLPTDGKGEAEANTINLEQDYLIRVERARMLLFRFRGPQC